MQTAVERKAEIDEHERSWVTKMKHLADIVLELTLKGTRKKNLMEVGEVGLWVVFR